YTLEDGKTIAGVEDIGKDGACILSGGKVERGHIAKYHSLTATSPNGFLTGADTARSLEEEANCFNPAGLKYRYYYYDWDRGHRYILNLHDNEVYTRYYHSLGKTADYYVPNGGADPENRYGLRGNGLRTLAPALTPASLLKDAYSLSNVKAVAPTGVEPAAPGQPGEVIFKVEGSNVITSLELDGSLLRRTADDSCTISVSTTNGSHWTEVWKGDAIGEVPLHLKLQGEVNGAYEVLVRVTLLGKAAVADAQLKSIQFNTITMLNSKTQPRLLLGKNTIYVGAGDPTESIVYWPDLEGELYKPYVTDEQNIATEPKASGYQGVMHAQAANKEAYVVFKM
ncbi:MAG: hypothetical protein M3Y56_13560, partial [Armatimonadota bacterium]|nr:hypothetical protein [Armatimonadota bacterium]